MGKRLERFCEAGIVDETNRFGLDFVKKTESTFWSTTRRGSSNLKKEGFGKMRKTRGLWRGNRVSEMHV